MLFIETPAYVVTNTSVQNGQLKGEPGHVDVVSKTISNGSDDADFMEVADTANNSRREFLAEGSTRADDSIINTFSATLCRSHQNSVSMADSRLYAGLECGGPVRDQVINSTGPAVVHIATCGGKLLVPVHIGDVHWVLAELDFLQRHAAVYDSLGYAHLYKHVLVELLVWYNAAREAQGMQLDLSGWRLFYKPCPLQQNDYDCGFFTMMAMTCIAFGVPLDYGQQDMPECRRSIALDCEAGTIRHTLPGGAAGGAGGAATGAV